MEVWNVTDQAFFSSSNHCQNPSFSSPYNKQKIKTIGIQLPQGLRRRKILSIASEREEKEMLKKNQRIDLTRYPTTLREEQHH